MNSIRIGMPARADRISTGVLAVIVALTLLTLALGAGVASASDGRDHRNAENTFTKWVTGPGVAPVLANMAGIVGGDVGDGTFAGEVMSKTPNATGAVIDAIYHFNGSRHSFTASVHVVQTGLHAVITGRVTEGWLSGNAVAGSYTQTTCAQSPAAGQTCFEGMLDVLRGTKSED